MELHPPPPPSSYLQSVCVPVGALPNQMLANFPGFPNTQVLEMCTLNVVDNKLESGVHTWPLTT